MVSTIEEWDKKVAPLLGSIRSKCMWLKNDARLLIERVEALPWRPEWETEAEAMMAEAITTMREALARMETAQATYIATVVEKK